MPKPISDSVVEQARVLRVEHCLSWSQIMKKLNLRSYEGIRRRLDPEYRERRNEFHKLRQRSATRGVKRPELAPLPSGSYHRGAGNVTSGRAVPPPHVIEELERVRSAPLTLSMLHFGDPPPGRSALDRTRAS